MLMIPYGITSVSSSNSHMSSYFDPCLIITLASSYESYVDHMSLYVHHVIIFFPHMKSGFFRMIVGRQSGLKIWRLQIHRCVIIVHMRRDTDMVYNV